MNNMLSTLTRAAVKSTAARLRSLGLLTVDSQWAVKAEICERCVMRVVQCNVSYCGKPLLSQIDRDPVTDGCGCPTRKKAQDPAEHCPLNTRHLAASRTDDVCNCKWCSQLNNS